MLRDNKACIIVGIVTIKLELEDVSESILRDVRYIPDLKRSLISLGVLDRECYSFKSHAGVLRVSKGSLLYIKGALKGGLYVLCAWENSCWRNCGNY